MHQRLVFFVCKCPFNNELPCEILAKVYQYPLAHSVGWMTCEYETFFHHIHKSQLTRVFSCASTIRAYWEVERGRFKGYPTKGWRNLGHLVMLIQNLFIRDSQMLHQWMMGHIIGKAGWNEPTATSAPVQDEVVQAVLGMIQKHILFPYPRIFQPPSLPQNFPLLPTSPLLLPTSPLLVSQPYFGQVWG